MLSEGKNNYIEVIGDITGNKYTVVISYSPVLEIGEKIPSVELVFNIFDKIEITENGHQGRVFVGTTSYFDLNQKKLQLLTNKSEGMALITCIPLPE